jgi:hypothetical protein
MWDADGLLGKREEGGRKREGGCETSAPRKAGSSRDYNYTGRKVDLIKPLATSEAAENEHGVADHS